jgi:hypothetical protein
LDILELVFVAEGEQIKNLINSEMLAVQKKIMESTKVSSGFMGRFWSSGKTNVVTINEMWHKLAKNNEIKKYKYLINDMSNLKKKEEGK